MQLQRVSRDLRDVSQQFLIRCCIRGTYAPYVSSGRIPDGIVPVVHKSTHDHLPIEKVLGIFCFVFSYHTTILVDGIHNEELFDGDPHILQEVSASTGSLLLLQYR